MKVQTADKNNPQVFHMNYCLVKGKAVLVENKFIMFYNFKWLLLAKIWAKLGYIYSEYYIFQLIYFYAIMGN